MLTILILVGLLALSIFIFLQQPQFGQLPKGERLTKIRQSPNYRNGSFQNISHTPDLTEGVSYWELMKEFFFDKKPRINPTAPIPSTKIDLHSLSPNENILVWFGHSSYFMQADGKRILVDPVLSGSASPMPIGQKAWAGTDRYTVADMPNIDYIFISHDHWDHLDYKTITQLKPKVGKVITGLGTGQHLEHWGYDPAKIIEHDWNDTAELDSGFTVHTLTARHFSGRSISRNKALWVSFLLQTPTKKIYIGGDSGYDTHFAAIGKKFGPIDLAIIENGQYDRKWKYIHLMPTEILQACNELQAKRIFPVHSSKFQLANHPWDEPLRLITQNNEKEKLNIITPIIGEKVDLNNESQKFNHWWEGVE